MRKRSKIRDFLSTIVLFGLLALAAVWFAKYNEVSVEGNIKVVDGDSLFVNDKEVRLLGIDAPEYTQTCQGKDGGRYACGKEARKHLVKLVGLREVICNGWEEDKYKRLLAVCMAGDVELNATMVLDGWAVAFGDYEHEERKASGKQRGLWGGRFQDPSVWRESTRDAHSSGWMTKFLGW